jgi:outer membrane receptor for ferrienterochelin and colicin
MKLSSIIFSLWLACLFSSHLVLAQADSSPLDPLSVEDLLSLSLEELMQVKVITTSKVEENISNAPGIVSVITAKEIQKFGANNLYEVLDRATGIYLPANWMYPQNTVSLRGDFGRILDTHVLLLLNGRPFRDGLTGGINNSFYVSLPLVAIEKIEIIRGPGSVLYGTNAFNGVINVITKKPTKSTTGQLTVTTGTLGTRSTEAYIAQSQGNFKWAGSARIFRERGWESRAVDNNGIMGSEDYSERNAGASWYGEYQDWKLNLTWLKDKQESWGERLEWSVQAPPGTENERVLADLGYSHKFSPNWHLDANLTYNYRQTYFNTTYDRTDESHKDSLLELTNYWQKDKFSWLLGGTIYRLTGRGIKFLPETYYYLPSYHETSYTLYTQADYQLTEATKFILGGQALKSPNLAWSFVPRIGLIHRFLEDFSLKILYSQAYRAAYPFEKTVASSSITGNPLLKPETVTTLDLQLLYKKKDYEFALTYFNSKQQDLIATSFDPKAIMFSYANQGKVDFHGIELEGKLMPVEHLYVVSSLTYQTNKNGAGKKNYSMVPNWTAKIGLSYDVTQSFSLGIFDSYFSKAHDVGVLTDTPVQHVNPETDAFHLMTVNLDWKLNQLFGWSNKQAVALNAYVYNALDEKIYTPEFARSVVNSIPGRQGRGVYVGIKYNFE